ncbi:MAG: AbrB/MazE/SpoVT family DNA-binding domain-containing protein [Mariprofundaceae bacterium]
MQTVTVSPKFQIVIPKEVREQLHIKPGQKMMAMPYGQHIHLVPVKPARQMRGILAGVKLDMSSIRDKTDRI